MHEPDEQVEELLEELMLLKKLLSIFMELFVLLLLLLPTLAPRSPSFVSRELPRLHLFAYLAFEDAATTKNSI